MRTMCIELHLACALSIVHYVSMFRITAVCIELTCCTESHSGVRPSSPRVRKRRLMPTRRVSDVQYAASQMLYCAVCARRIALVFLVFLVFLRPAATALAGTEIATAGTGRFTGVITLATLVRPFRRRLSIANESREVCAGVALIVNTDDDDDASPPISLRQL